MKESNFRFEEPILISVHFDVNGEFRREKGKAAPMSILASGNTQRSAEKKESILEFILRINYEDEKERKKDAPFWVTAVYAAKFFWDDSIPEETVEQLLDGIAPSLLMSYIRPLVAQLTSLSPFPTYHIPYLNITKISEENIEES